MPSSDPDIVVIGSGPNGLSAACTLARRGFRVLVLEANSQRPGGAVGSDSGTLPGFTHDVGAAFFPFGRLSPAFRALDLERAGVSWVRAPVDSAHPAPDGSTAIITADADFNAQHFGSSQDGDTWRALGRWHRRIEARLLATMLGPLPTLGPMLRLGPVNWLRLARIFLSSGAGLSRRLFSSEAARRVLPGLALHVDAGPEDRFGAGIGYMLGLTGMSGGYLIPRGGSQSIANALVDICEHHGGRLRLGSHARRIVVRGGQAHAVKLDDGEEIRATRAILADTAAPTLMLDMLDEAHVPRRVLSSMQAFPFGFATFKVDWALSAPVPWNDPHARNSAVVHLGDSLEDLTRFTTQVRSGQLPDNPYLVIGQQSLWDPTRAPESKHTLWCYTRVPIEFPGWEQQRERFVDRIEQRIEAQAPGFTRNILERRVVTPADLMSMDENLVHGDLGGGSNAWNRQLVFRPVFPYFRYRTPVRRLYLCSSYAHPGAGVHGMCGFNAAQIAARDLS